MIKAKRFNKLRTFWTARVRPIYHNRVFWWVILLSGLLTLVGLLAAFHTSFLLDLVTNPANYATAIAALAVLTPLMVAAISSLGKLEEKWKELQSVRERVRKTEETIVKEKARNSRIEAKANTAAQKVEAVAIQTDQNQVDLELIKYMLGEASEDKKTILELHQQILDLKKQKEGN